MWWLHEAFVVAGNESSIFCFCFLAFTAARIEEHFLGDIFHSTRSRTTIHCFHFTFAGGLGVHRIAASHHNQFTEAHNTESATNDDHFGLFRRWNVCGWSAHRNLCRFAEILISPGSRQSGQILQWWWVLFVIFFCYNLEYNYLSSSSSHIRYVLWCQN